MRKVILLILVFVFIGILKSQSLTLKINNKTDYNIEGIRVANQQTVSIYRGDFIVVQDLKEIIVKNLSLLPVYLNTGFIYNKPNSWTSRVSTYEPPYFHDTLRNCEIEYDLNISENQYGYKLFYTFVKIKRKPAITNKSISQKNAWISDRLVGEYYPINTEGDSLPAVCKEGSLQINDDNTFNYILTPDKEWCEDMKEYSYEGSCEEKGDTLILYNKGFKIPVEPRFSIMDVDTGKTILIALFNNNGEAINIE